ncbi:hypothetical protein ADICYQ_3631 [Cyclobacterium qasimii M12-11B]|uniref:Uncharacterized protein n=1 Tax=Cyclobacterium qasimii M12-11B TaxID=641524 RepID=S7WTC9_9BACT|nr:hypothetical protein ADICYQ_3631 [Cyclobacterium qasimii M12-11B]
MRTLFWVGAALRKSVAISLRWRFLQLSRLKALSKPTNDVFIKLNLVQVI